MGCAVLREEGFDADELEALSAALDPAATPLYTDYYPLPRATVGERFPEADEDKVARMEPVPEERGQDVAVGTVRRISLTVITPLESWSILLNSEVGEPFEKPRIRASVADSAESLS